VKTGQIITHHFHSATLTDLSQSLQNSRRVELAQQRSQKGDWSVNALGVDWFCFTAGGRIR
jgi:hypothetical protein